MSATIQQLPSLLVNQIAAGEVIERPASVVKELLENALDAHATMISIDIRFGGFNAISIRDNGEGMDEINLPLAVAPHATSKIRDIDDLFRIQTMGFRGEALASIASVSHCLIQSKTCDQVHGWELSVNEGVVDLRPCARDVGTTVVVKDLFYNTPVRKKFLGSERTEFLAIDRVVRCFALSAPGVSLEFHHQGQCVFQVPAADGPVNYKHRLQKILGKAFVDAAVPVAWEGDGLCIQGYVAQPSYARSQQDRLWIYVNRRMVNDKLLNHAVKHAYEDRLVPGRYPCCLLEISIDPAEVDVNVHPTKHEIRFHQARWVHDALREAVRSVLAAADETSVSTVEEPLRSVERSEVQKLESMVGSPLEWLDLNASYALITSGRSRYLLHTLGFYQNFLKEQIFVLPLPWDPRPLLVPISIELDDVPHHACDDESLTLLAQFGLTFSWMGQARLMIRSTPVMMPYLDLKAAVRELFLQTELNFEKIKAILMHHQCLDAGVVSEHDKQSWMAYLAEKPWSSQAAYLKLLSIEHCAVLFHAS